MELCLLQQLDGGRWWCPKCDPDKERLLPVNAHRNCIPPAERERRRQAMRERRKAEGGVQVSQSPIPNPQSPIPNPFRKGVGDHLHDLIAWIVGELPMDGCDCGSHIAQMNAWGPAGYREHIEEIVDWLLSEAEKRNWKSARWFGARTAVKTLVRWAIRRAERGELHHRGHGERKELKIEN